MKSRPKVIPLKMRAAMGEDPENKTCALYGQLGHACEGRITWEHAIISAGQRVQQPWAIIPLCEKAHGVDHFQDAGTLVKEINQWIALSRATEKDLLALFGENEYTPLCKAKGVFQQKAYLVKKYGPYVRQYPPVAKEVPVATVAPQPALPEPVRTPVRSTLVNTSKQRKPWYLLSERDQEIVKAARVEFAQVDGMHFTDWETITKILRIYAEDHNLAVDKPVEKYVENL